MYRHLLFHLLHYHLLYIPSQLVVSRIHDPIIIYRPSFFYPLLTPHDQYIIPHTACAHTPHLCFSISLTSPKYTAVQATKTFSRSGSSKNSFSWRTITKEFQSSIAVFNVVLNFAFHTQEDSIDCNPEYSSVELGDKSTIV